MLAIDQSFLGPLLFSGGKPPNDPKTGAPIDRFADRINELIASWEDNGDTVIIPTPVLTQFLILASDKASEYLTKLNESSHFRIEAFDQRAAVELANIHIDILKSTTKGRRKREEAQGTWAKVNLDRQIVAIAKVHRATTIYSDDEDLCKFADRVGIKAIRTWELPTPKATQPELFEEDRS